MATLNSLTKEVKRKLGLTQGSHTLTFTASTVDADTITIDGLKMTLRATQADNEWNINRSANANNTAAAFNAAIGDVMTSDQGISSTVDGAVATVTGARTIVSSNPTQCAVAISDTEMDPPIYSDILVWIKEGQLDVTNKLNDQSLMAEGTSMVEESTSISASLGVTELTPPTDFLRPITFSYTTTTAGDSESRAEKVPFDLLVDIRDGRHPFFKMRSNPEEGNKWYSIFNSKIQLAEPSSAGSPHLLYIKKPQTVAATECDLPESLEKMVVDSACSRALSSIGKEEEAQVYMQQYFLDIQMMNIKYMSEEKASHETKESLLKLEAMSRNAGGN